MTWGNGSINDESISTLVKDFRKDSEEVEYGTVEAIVNDFKSFLENKITPETSLGFLIAGYSKGEGHPEMFLININMEILKIQCILMLMILFQFPGLAKQVS